VDCFTLFSEVDRVLNQITDVVVPIHFAKEGQLPAQLNRLWCLYEIMRAKEVRTTGLVRFEPVGNDSGGR
jgi:hypothetical protein